MNEDYYESLLTGGSKGVKTEINPEVVKLYISRGLSSVKISRLLKVSYPTVLKFVDKSLPELSKKLRINGKKHQIRRAANASS